MLASIFVFTRHAPRVLQVNVEADDKAQGGDLQKEKQAKELAAQNFINEDRALMRFEFLEAIVRIAVQKYKAAAGGDVSSALEVLMTGHVAPFFNHRGDKGDGAALARANAASAAGSLAEGDAAAKAALTEHAAAATAAAASPDPRGSKTAAQFADDAAGWAPLAGKASQVLFVDPNAWRVGALYKHTVDAELRAHQRMLDMVYASYCK